MARLISDAAALTDVQEELGLTVDANSMSFDNIIKAIQVTQANMGIMGTTAKEASTTIEGSVNSMKAAFENLLTGIADENADLDELIEIFVSSVETAANNIIPRIIQILSGMGGAIQKIAPIISKQIPILIENVVPSLLLGGVQLVTAIISGIVSAIPNIKIVGNKIIEMLNEGIINNIPNLISTLPTILENIVNFFIDSIFPSIIDLGINLITSVSDGIIEGLPILINKLPTIIENITQFLTDNLPIILQTGIELIDSLAYGIIEAIPQLVSKLPSIINNIQQFMQENYPKIIKSGAEILGKLIVGIIGAIPDIVKELPAVIKAIADAFLSQASLIVDIGKALIEGLWSGISEKIGWLKGKINGFIDTIKEWFTGSDGFDTHSPSKWSGEIGKNIDEGLANEIDKNKFLARNSMGNVVKEISKAIPSLKYGIENLNAQLSPAYATNGAYIPNTQNIIKTINNNTTSTMRIVADKQGIFDLVVDESNRRGKSLIEGRGL